MNPLTETDIAEAATRLIDAFAATDAERYFACFAADADFVFHTEPQRLRTRAEYEVLWADWIASGWRIEQCASSDARIRVLGDSAVFVHDVHTAALVDGEREEYDERETIVFTRDPSGQILAVHEHLSPTVKEQS